MFCKQHYENVYVSWENRPSSSQQEYEVSTWLVGPQPTTIDPLNPDNQGICETFIEANEPFDEYVKQVEVKPPV